jgi:hypothetical protein
LEDLMGLFGRLTELAGGTPNPETARQRAHRIMRATMLVLTALVFAGVVAMIFVAAFAKQPARVAATAALVAGAALVSGGLLGFLFGIPRTLQIEVTDKSKRSYQVNTNLEQISDWLTKIIVGVTLIQIRSIPGRLMEINEYVGPSLGGGREGEVIAGACIVFFAVIGFFCGYLGTRLYVAGAIPWADDAGNISEAVDAAKPAVQRASGKDALQPPVSETSPPSAPPDPAVKQLVRVADSTRVTPEQLSPEEARTMALSYYFNNRFADAVPFFDRANMNPNAESQFTMQHAIALGESGDYRRCVEMLEALARQNKGTPHVYQLLGYYLLWVPERITDAVKYNQQYLTETGRDDATSLFNLACAYDQIGDDFRRKGDGDHARMYTDLAGAELKRSLKLEPRFRARAEELRNRGENFRAFTDAEFTQILAASAT